ncbi:OsmC family protein [Acidobacteriota bacterium]
MKEATVTWVQGRQFIGTANSGHAVVTDIDSKHGGSDSAVRPGELTLIALGSCTGTDVVGTLEKMRLPVEDFRIEVRAEAAQDHPKVWTEIWIKFIIRGDVPEEKLERAIALSRDTYCSVGAMLKKSATVHYDYEIHPPSGVTP